jgi:uncharacterized protein YjgD (DUF1641 family)
MANTIQLQPSPAPREPDLARELARMNERLDTLNQRVEHLYRKALAAEELKDELVPVLKDAMAAMSDKLGEMETEFNSEQVLHLLRKVLRSTPRFIRALEQLENLESLVDELSPLGRDIVRSTVETLQHAEDRGWFRMSQGAMELFDRIAAGTTQEDLDRLGDNMMLIVNTVKRMTQPQMLAVANNALGALDAEHEAPPKVSLWRLMRSMRDPEVQSGLAVMLELTRQIARRPQIPPNGDQRKEL